MATTRNAREGFTYDDMLLVPRYSEILPTQTNVKTRLSTNIELSIPLVAAAMDTVSESRFAIRIAELGGIAVIHKNLSPEDQARHVAEVKKAASGIVRKPITVHVDDSIRDAKILLEKHRNSIGGFPVMKGKAGEEELEGILTRSDLEFATDDTDSVSIHRTHLDDLAIMYASEVMDGDHLNLEKAEKFLLDNKKKRAPLVFDDDSGSKPALVTLKDIQKIKAHPNATRDKYGRLRVAAAVGTSKSEFDRAVLLVDAGVDALVVDTAHGHSKGVVDFAKKLVDTFNETVDIIVGNIATAEAARMLVNLGVDAVKVGIGPGSICTTRVIAGIGVPQLTAVEDVVRAVDGAVPVIADGGIKSSGDIVKALAVGASSAMIGSMFAATEEAPGVIFIAEGRKFKSYRGMGSIEAMQKGSKDRYFQSETEDAGKLVAEGVSGRVPLKGKLADVVHQLVGGIRAGMGYCGAPDLEFLFSSTEFVKISSASLRESHPHDVTITREAPNYTSR